MASGSQPNGRSPPAYPGPTSFPPAYQYPLNVPSASLKGIPFEFRVGSRYVLPLVSGSAIMAHLRLLAAFHVLEHWASTVSSPRDAAAAASTTDPSKPLRAARWRVFLHQAVWRFELWVTRIISVRTNKDRGVLKDEEIPPLDVILVWHTYLLNPRAYADDARRVFPELAFVGGLPLERIAAQINPMTLEFESTPSQAEYWERMTRAPHEPLSLTLASRDEIPLTCPRCAGPPVKVPWLREPYRAPNGHALGTGWCQNKFSVRCGNCQFEITRESIAVGRFAADIAAAMMDKNHVLPGTLFDPCEFTLSDEIAQRMTALFIQPFVNLPPAQQAIGEHLGWSYSGLETSIAEARQTLIDAAQDIQTHDGQETPYTIGLPTRGRKELSARILEAQKAIGSDAKGTWVSYGPRIAKMVAAYRDNPTPFSMELVGGIIRQTGFTSKAFHLGWLDPSNPHPPISQAITRYHNFLHLLSQFAYFLVPTLDIDLGWHTHQLAGDVYLSDTKRCVGRFIDHEDKVEEGVLSNSFDTTSRVWETAFHTPYSACEPLRSAAITFPKLPKFARRLSSTESGPSQDLMTFPSEHQSIVVLRDYTTSAQRLERERKRAKGTRWGSSKEEDAPFLRRVYTTKEGREARVVAFGELGRAGWAVRGAVDQAVMDGRAVAMGQCCAGYGMPYYGRPLWVVGARPTGEWEVRTPTSPRSSSSPQSSVAPRSPRSPKSPGSPMTLVVPTPPSPMALSTPIPPSPIPPSPLSPVSSRSTHAVSPLSSGAATPRSSRTDSPDAVYGEAL